MTQGDVLHRPLRGGSCRLVLLGALLAVAALLPGTASAAPERGALVVEGRGGSTGELVVREQVSVSNPVPELAGGGGYVGVLIEPANANPATGRLGAVQVRAFEDATRDGVAVVGADGILEPGRYRVTLLGEGPVRARWALNDPDAPGLQAVPRTRIPVRFLGRAETLPAGRASARVDLPGAAPAGRRVLQVLLRDGVRVGDERMCATTGQQCPGNPAPLCPPVLPCGDEALPTAMAGTSPGVRALLHEPATTARALRWSVDGYSDVDDRLRAAAIVF